MTTERRAVLLAVLVLLLGAPTVAFQSVRQALSEHGAQTLAQDDADESAFAAVGSGWTDTYDAAVLLQDFVEVQRRDAKGEVHSVQEPADLTARVEAVRHRLEALGAVARNTTGDFLTALQLAAVVTEMKRLRLSGLPHLHPSVHVARKHRPVIDGSKHVLPGIVHEQEVLMVDFRRLIAFAGTALLLVSVLLTVNKKQLALAVFNKGKTRSSCETTDSTVDPHSPACVKDWNVWDGTVATFSCLVGTGLLAMPYAFALAGTIAGPILVFFVCCSVYTAHILSRSMNQCGKFSLGALVEDAFGPFARKAVESFMTVELWSYLLSATVCGSLNVVQLWDDCDSATAVVIFTIAVYVLSFVPAQAMTHVSVLSNVVFVICCGMFLLTGFMLPERAPAADVQFVKPHGLLSAAGILVFSPAGHSFYPAVLSRMKEPAKFPQCVNRAYGAVLVVYLVVAMLGYWLFGNATQPSAVLNIGSDLKLNPLPSLGWMGGVAAAGLVVKMLALAVLVLSTLVSTVQHAFASADGRLPGALPIAAVTPLLLVSSAAVSIHFANDVARLLNLMGSVFCMNIAFVLPVLCFWRSTTEPIGIGQRVVFVCLVAMGLTFAAVGLVSAV